MIEENHSVEDNHIIYNKLIVQLKANENEKGKKRVSESFKHSY